jgi:hypothetical protein
VGVLTEALISSVRRVWTGLTDDQLLAQCVVDTYRASGPGGQKRNKTSSAVRLRHPPSGLSVIAEESRSQHENRARALRRMRQALFLKVRDNLPAEELNVEKLEKLEDYRAARSPDGRLRMSRKDPRFWPAVGVALDVLDALDCRVADAAAALGISTGNLISFLETDPKVWGEVNILRTRCGRRPLHS